VEERAHMPVGPQEGAGQTDGRLAGRPLHEALKIRLSESAIYRSR